MEINKIATFHSPFTSKFGIPKQSGLVKTLEGQIVFEPKFRTRDALRGIEEFDYLADLGIFGKPTHSNKSCRTTSVARRQYEDGRFCNTVTISPECIRPVIGPSGSC